VILLIIFLVVLFIALVVCNYVFLTDSSVVTAVAFQDQTQASVFDGNLIINAHDDDTQSSHTFVIYSQNRDTIQVQLSLSDLYEVGSKVKIPSVEVTPIDVSSSVRLFPENTRVFSFSTETANQPGLYQGSLFVEDGVDVATVPFELDVKPPITKPMIIVIDGIAISIVLWKFIAYYNRLYSPKDDKKKNRVNVYQDLYNRSNVGTSMSGAIHYAVYREVFVKNLVLDAGTIIFGIGLALIGLPANEAVLNVRAISDLDFLTLIGIGLGIGSLKEVISRV
jgi:hypothetical protein